MLRVVVVTIKMVNMLHHQAINQSMGKMVEAARA
jgi:gamma-glutamyl-gamma-aminobutyrate hydrolase PuuD